MTESIKNTILDKLQDQNVSMRPKWVFVLKSILFFTGSILIFLALAYGISFIVFHLRQSGALYIPAFGMHSIFVFLTLLPWALIVVTIVFLFILEVLVRRFAFAYRRPLIISSLLLVGGVALLSLIFDLSMVHSRARDFARQHHVRDPFNPYTPDRAPKDAGVFRGSVITIVPTGFIIEDVFGSSTLIMIDERTRMPSPNSFATNTEVVIFGEKVGEDIHAFGIRIVPD